jgi:hypothetical protein
VRASNRGLVFHPVLLIVDDGSRRVGVNPWARNQSAADPGDIEGVLAASTPQAPRSDVRTFLGELQQSLGDALLTGLDRDAAHAKVMAERSAQSRRLGFVHVADAVTQLADSLAARRGTLRWDPAPAVERFQNLCVIVRVAAE